MKLTLALLSFGSLAGQAVAANCSANCLPDLVGGPYTCDELITQWRSDDNNTLYSPDNTLFPGRLKELTCDSLTEFNCCDCSGCFCDEDPPETTTTTASYDCYECHNYLFGGAVDTPILNTLHSEEPGVLHQFYTNNGSDAWQTLDPHQSLEGCELAALNGLDCSSCGCACGLPPANVDCVQSNATCTECPADIDCGVQEFSDCTYVTHVDAQGLGLKCASDYQLACPFQACTAPPDTSTATSTTTDVQYDCDARYEGGILDAYFPDQSCNEAAQEVTCETIRDSDGALCMDYGCPCICGSTDCVREGVYKCVASFNCDDPCTEYVGFPDLIPETCEELLTTRTEAAVQTLFDTNGINNYCASAKCCTSFAEGGGMPETDPYTCFVPTTTTVTDPPNVTTSICDITLLGNASDASTLFSPNDLVERDLSCYEIASYLGGMTVDVNGVVSTLPEDEILARLTYYPELPVDTDYLELARTCGCQDRCSDQCDGCNNLTVALAQAGFDTASYFCEDILEDFNLDCSNCDCSNPEACDEPSLSSHGIFVEFTTPTPIDISCNDLHDLGLNCFEIEYYAAAHGQPGLCDNCECTATTDTPLCDIPCGGGEYGGESSSGFLNTSKILSCNDFNDAGLTCEQAEHAGCNHCDQCGCTPEQATSTTVQSCFTECNSLGLSCSQLVLAFTCDELEESIFDGCNCGDCECQTEFSEYTCDPTCIAGMTCDELVIKTPSDRHWYTCDNLEKSYGCDCRGCECENFATEAVNVTGDCATTTSCLDMDCQTVAEMSELTYYELEETYGCDCTGCPGCDPQGCKGVSCEVWQQTLALSGSYVSCDTLEEDLLCNCDGCACGTTTTTVTEPLECATTCDSASTFFGTSSAVTCDELRALDDTLSCAYLETFFACDCTACLCEQVPLGVCD